MAVTGPVGLNVDPPESPPDAVPEEAAVGGSVLPSEADVVGNVDAASASRPVGGDVPPDPSEDVNGVGAVVVPAATSPASNVGGGVGSAMSGPVGVAVPATITSDVADSPVNRLTNPDFGFSQVSTLEQRFTQESRFGCVYL